MELSPVHFPECPPRPQGPQGTPKVGQVGLCSVFAPGARARWEGVLGSEVICTGNWLTPSAFLAETVRSTEDPEIAPLRPSLIFFTTPPKSSQPVSVRLRHDTLINNDIKAIKAIAIATPACHLF
ncbi:hypothetical protein CCUS01_11491 [Colletotrichum cuscutae]|uniref:Uncharacterized protein n=1 Tax=Colletotrichum cuscutae TaxID=1209917 RepID=A0AAI9XHL0_9PEZI|nr:hypothetical protein CCUS01_11491 [Colletotrichum cuscutae]